MNIYVYFKRDSFYLLIFFDFLSTGHVATVIRIAPSLFLHALIQIIVHFGFSVCMGRILKIPFKETVLASNANVGGK